mgnify:CR=1 FL=1
MYVNVGDKISRFRVVQPLGEGGMCSVYLAFDETNFEYVALKLLDESKADDPVRARSLFTKEAELSANLSHPNLVAFVACGEERGRHYIAYEYITGVSLAELISQRGALDIELALSVIQDISRGLLAAHQRGVIHCDIKPHNIMITEENVIKLIDFGIASLAAGATVEVTKEDDESEPIGGTLAYAAPEQNRGQMVDKPSDIYSLGLVFFEILTGKRALKADEPSKIPFVQMTLEKQLPKVNELNRRAPEALDQIIRKMVAFNQTNRYWSAEELVADLDAKLPATGLAASEGLRRVKELALRELSETYFFEAISATREGRFLDGLIQFERLLALSSNLASIFGRKMQRELIAFFWRLHLSYKSWDIDGGNSVGLDLETYVLLLQKLGAIFHRLALFSLVPLVERRLSLLLRDCDNDESRLKYYRGLFACSPFLERSAALMTDYVDTCRRVGSTSEMNSLMGYLANNLSEEGLHPMAAYVYEEALETFPDDEWLKEGQQKLDERAQSFQKARASFEELFNSFTKGKNIAAAVKLCHRHLETWEFDAFAMEKLASLLDDGKVEAMDSGLCEVWMGLGRLYFLQESFVRARRCVVRALQCEHDFEPALAYLFELLLWDGKEIRSVPSLREMVITCYLEAGMGQEAIDQMEAGLLGGEEDIAVLKRILATIDRLGLKVDRPEYLFKMAAALLACAHLDEARHFFLEAIELCDEPQALIARIRTLPGGDTVFNSRQLMAKLRTLKH